MMFENVQVGDFFFLCHIRGGNPELCQVARFTKTLIATGNNIRYRRSNGEAPGEATLWRARPARLVERRILGPYEMILVESPDAGPASKSRYVFVRSTVNGTGLGTVNWKGQVDDAGRLPRMVRDQALELLGLEPPTEEHDWQTIDLVPRRYRCALTKKIAMRSYKEYNIYRCRSGKKECQGDAVAAVFEVHSDGVEARRTWCALCVRDIRDDDAGPDDVVVEYTG